MNSLALLLAFSIGVVAGLRSLTAPAVVAWAAHLGWLNLHGSPLAFMGSVWAVAIFTLLALVEFVADQLPTTPGAYGCRRADGPNCHGSAERGLPRCCGRRAPLAGCLARGDRRNCRNIWRLPGPRRPGPRASCPGFCDRRPGRPGRDQPRTAYRFSILRTADLGWEPQRTL